MNEVIKDWNDAHIAGVDILKSADAQIAEAMKARKRQEIANEVGDAVKRGSDRLESVQPWPKLSRAAMYGLAGEIAHIATEHSEADPVAVHLTMLTSVGAMMGRSRYFCINDSYHHARLMTALVGGTGKGRKGTSWGPVHRLILATQDKIRAESTVPFPLGKPLQIHYGPLSSGEGLVDSIRDKMNDEDEYGTEDKRLLVIEAELGAALRAIQRNGNNLSTMMRNAWDGTTLSPMTKRQNRITATNPHICVVAHVTSQELSALLGVGDIWGGFANRFLWTCVRRRAIVPFPKSLAQDDVDRISSELARVVRYQAEHPREMRLTNSASDLWANVYLELQSVEHSGVLGACTSRGEAQTLRLALTFALIDGSDWIEERHIEAGLSMWRYADDSARYLFGGSESDPIGSAIKQALSAGAMAQNDIRDLFGRHVPAARLADSLKDLQDRGQVTFKEEKTGGRPRRMWSLA
ncbi:DUF3987 domain-containing protein [Hyphomicrobium sp. B1]|uniref:DUF3987 domain-containing protein n=1 Tax=Hyphomicrobium sp. B1 TaxID=3075651 RepID=UPI003C2EA29A